MFLRRATTSSPLHPPDPRCKKWGGYKPPLNDKEIENV